MIDWHAPMGRQPRWVQAIVAIIMMLALMATITVVVCAVATSPGCTPA